MQYLEEVRNLRRRLTARHRAGEYWKCMILGEKLIQLHKRNKNTDSLNFADDLFNLACVYEDTGRFDKAVELYSNSLKIVEGAMGIGVEYADRLTNLAVVYGKIGDYNTSIKMLFEVESIKKAKLGENHQAVADAIYNIANSFFEASNAMQAITMHKKALKIREKSDDSDPMMCADSLNSLGYCYEAVDNLAEADACYLEALSMTEAFSGELSEGYIADLLHYSTFLLRIGRFEHAVKSYEKSALLIKKLYSENHLYYAGVINNTADAYEKLGNLKKSISLKVKSLGMMKKILGENHIYFANTLKSIAIGYHTLGDIENAIKNIKKDLKIKEPIVGCASEDYIKDMLLLILFHLESYDYKKIADVLKKYIKNVKFDSEEDKPVFYDGITKLYFLTNEISKMKQNVVNGKGTSTEDLNKIGKLTDLFKQINDDLDNASSILRQID